MCTLLACVLLTQRLIFTEHDSGCFSPFFKKRNFLVKYGTHVSRVSRKGSGFNRHLALITEPGVSPSVIKKSNRRSVLCSAVAVARLNIGHTLRKFPDSVIRRRKPLSHLPLHRTSSSIYYTPFLLFLQVLLQNFSKISKINFNKILHAILCNLHTTVTPRFSAASRITSDRTLPLQHIKNFGENPEEISPVLCTF